MEGDPGMLDIELSEENVVAQRGTLYSHDETKINWEAKSHDFRVAVSPSLHYSNVLCEWRHLKTHAEFLNHRVS